MPLLASPPLDASASPVRSTSTSSGSEPAGSETPELAQPPGPAVARPVRDTRRPLPDTVGSAAHTATPTAATAASADTTTAILFALFHPNSTRSTPSTATTPAVAIKTARLTLTPISCPVSFRVRSRCCKTCGGTGQPLTLKCEPRPWPLVSLLPIAAIPLAGQVLSRSSSCVRSPGRFTEAVALRSQTALTGSAWPWTIPQREHGHPVAEPW